MSKTYNGKNECIFCTKTMNSDKFSSQVLRWMPILNLRELIVEMLYCNLHMTWSCKMQLVYFYERHFDYRWEQFYMHIWICSFGPSAMLLWLVEVMNMYRCKVLWIVVRAYVGTATQRRSVDHGQYTTPHKRRMHTCNSIHHGVWPAKA